MNYGGKHISRALLWLLQRSSPPKREGVHYFPPLHQLNNITPDQLFHSSTLLGTGGENVRCRYDEILNLLKESLCHLRKVSIPILPVLSIRCYESLLLFSIFFFFFWYDRILIWIHMNLKSKPFRPNKAILSIATYQMFLSLGLWYIYHRCYTFPLLTSISSFWYSEHEKGAILSRTIWANRTITRSSISSNSWSPWGRFLLWGTDNNEYIFYIIYYRYSSNRRSFVFSSFALPLVYWQSKQTEGRWPYSNATTR